jgi:hypothetical protein
VIGRDPVQRHEADVVAVARVFRTRIAKPHEKPHRRLLLLVPKSHARRLVASPACAPQPLTWPQPPVSLRKKPEQSLRVTVVASMRNEGPFIVEWVTWYRMLGFTNIVVVTNNCTDHSPELLDALGGGALDHSPALRCAAGQADHPPQAGRRRRTQGRSPGRLAAGLRCR